MRARQCLFALLAFVLTAVPQLDAQQITGRVTTEGGQPLAAVQVFIAGTGIGALSQQNGRYLLLNVPAGTHTVTAERIGYRSVSAQITVAAGETVAPTTSSSRRRRSAWTRSSSRAPRAARSVAPSATRWSRSTPPKSRRRP
jgi:iron complex outermembrane receptor protein